LTSYSAPSVAYPTGRSVWLSPVLVVMLLLGLLTAGLYSYQTRHALHGLRWQEALIATSWMLAMVCIWQFLHQLKRGCLAWDGLFWHWTASAPVGHPDVHPDVPSGQAGGIKVRFDGQVCLLIQFQPDLVVSRTQWLWLERTFAPELWHDVRRAVYSRANEPVLNTLH
jgi:hypothetical protein